MSRYRKIDPRIWNDEKFRSLSDDAKLVFFFLLTHPHMTALGAMRASIPGLAAEINQGLKAFREAFREPLSKQMVRHDEKASLVWLPNFLKYNKPESPNVVKSWVQSADLLPECAMKTQVIQAAKALLETLDEGFLEALPKAFRDALAKTMPNQEQEQEQDIYSGAKAPKSFSTSKKKKIKPADPVQLEAFEVFYKAYPLHIGRAEAEKVWLKLNPDAALTSRIMTAECLYAEEVRDTERKFIKHPAAWLNARRWEDEHNGLDEKGDEWRKEVFINA